VVLPQIASSAACFLWKLYLFITVHVIIFIIYKLSDNKHFHAAAQQHKDPWAPVPHHPARPVITEAMFLSALKGKKEYRVPLPVSRPDLEAVVSSSDEGVVSPRSCGGESFVTTESEEEPASSAVDASDNFATADTSRSVEPAPAPAPKRAVVVPAPAPAPAPKRDVVEPAPAPAGKRAVVVPSPTPAPAATRKRAVVVPAPAPKLERAVVDRVVSLPHLPAAAAMAEYFDGTDHDDGGGDDDLDSTWNTIMQKKRPATAPASTPSEPAPSSSPARPPPSPRIRIREPSVRAAELNRRADDFIKKIHSSFGRNQ
jgi:hypothetical protein